jgi:hypothetical protein
MPYLLLLVALTLSSVAAFYSIVGLAVIFSGAFVAVVIMGTALEIAKVLTTLWLHRYWHEIPLLLKSYLTAAVVVLMLITSMGIFGFLSKAHLEQEYAQASLIAESEAKTSNLATVDKQLEESKNRLSDLSSNTWFDEIKTRIDIEQQELTQLQQQRDALLTSSQASNAQLQVEIANAESLLKTRKISALQTLLGLAADGRYGASTSTAYDQYIAERQDKLSQANTSILDTQITQAQARIENLQSQLVSPEETKAEITRYRERVSSLTTEREELSESLVYIQKEINAFAAEVGPITFISELFFDELNDKSQGTTVRILIFTIILVFDPLAVLLVIAASITMNKKSDVVKDSLPALSRLQELLKLESGVLYWKERDDKAFNARWANKQLGKTATIDGKSYKTAILLNKMIKR